MRGLCECANVDCPHHKGEECWRTYILTSYARVNDYTNQIISVCPLCGDEAENSGQWNELRKGGGT